ncbi:MAG: GTP 3',8-cyclase MoaA [Ruminococcaceae bacterium]|nr:GTP 3',8-cyclase MoaA [Oscillospiraceae bacterium]
MIDNYGREIRYLRLSVTERCNLRCRYCMPEDGVFKKRHEDMLSEDEMIMVVEAASRLGINKLRITGGEPLIKKNIVSICSRASAVKGIDEVCVTTNGTLLPEMASELREAGVNRVNISLDTLSREKYAYMSRRGELDTALRGIEAAIYAGFDKVKINTVLIGGFNDDEISSLAELTVKYPVDLRFIELMPMYDSGDFDEKSYVSSELVLKTLPDLIHQKAADGVAKLYKIPGALGSIGIISPVSNHFCASCDRIRVTADGKVKPCLHSDIEYSLKGYNTDEMEQILKSAILSKPLAHEPLSLNHRSGSGRNMNEIGG